MSIDLQTERPIPLAEAARLIPPARRGKRTHLSTVLRWILDGARTPTGERCRLEAVRLGGRWMTSHEALQRFSQALTPQRDGRADSPRSPASRERASRQAERQLEKLGI